MPKPRSKLTAVPELIPKEELGPDRWWAQWGACIGLDPALFFPEKGADPYSVGTEARRTCANCSVLIECRSHGVWYESHGFWGGLSNLDRRWVRNQLGYVLPHRPELGNHLVTASHTNGQPSRVE